MKITLEYVDGEVVAKDSITDGFVNEKGLSDLFWKYYQRIKEAFHKEMSTMEMRMANLGGYANKSIDSKLKMELELKDIQK